MSRRSSRSRIRVQDRPQGGAKTAWILVLLSALSFLLYLNTLGHGFVFDDITLILQNPQVLNFDIPGIFSLQGYRPVRTLTHALEWAVFGRNPMVFHFNNILLHALNVLLLFFFLGKLTRSRPAALAGSLFFMIHPVQTAAVAYISGRKDLLATFFLLLGFLFYQRVGDPAKSRTWQGPAAWGCFLLALLSKEVAIVFPVILLGLDMAGDARSPAGDGKGENLFRAFWRAIKVRPLQYGVFFVLAVSSLAWAVFINIASRAEGYWGGSLLTNIGTGFKLFAHYLKLVFVPHPLIADYTGNVFPVSTSLLEPATILSFLLLVTYLGIAVWVFRISPIVSFGMLWFAAALSPVLHFIPFHELAADHFLYFPLVGAAVCFSVLVKLLEGKTENWKKVGVALLVILAVIAGILTVDRNRDWKDQETLWRVTYEQAPESYRANVNLGQMAFSANKIREGINFTEKAIELDPTKAPPRSNLGALFYTLGQQASANRDYAQAKNLLHQSIEYCRTALELDPSRIFTAVNYGNAYKELANVADAENNPELAAEYREEAERFYARALESGDERKEIKSAWLNLGLMNIDAGNFDEAISHLDRFISAYQGDQEVWRGYYWKGYAQYSIGRFSEAAASFESAAELNPTDMTVLNSLVNCYEKLGNEAKKIRTFERALEVNPQMFSALYNLGLIYQERGEPKKSRDYFRRALAADPDNMLAEAIRRHLEEIE